MERILSKVLESWREPYVFVAVLIAAFLALLYFFSGVNFAAIPTVNLAGYTAILIVMGIFWFLAQRPPRARKNRIGIVVAISAETDEQRRRIQEDFISALRTSLEDSKDIIRFDFIALPRWHAEIIAGNAERAEEYLRKCRAHLLIFGTARLRIINKKESHVLNLRQIVVHRPLPVTATKELSQEMADVFSPRINIDRENDLLGLELASTWLAEAAKYFRVNADSCG